MWEHSEVSFRESLLDDWMWTVFTFAVAVCASLLILSVIYTMSRVGDVCSPLERIRQNSVSLQPLGASKSSRQSKGKHPASNGANAGKRSGVPKRKKTGGSTRKGAKSPRIASKTDTTVGSQKATALLTAEKVVGAKAKAKKSNSSRSRVQSQRTLAPPSAVLEECHDVNTVTPTPPPPISVGSTPEVSEKTWASALSPSETRKAPKEAHNFLSGKKRSKTKKAKKRKHVGGGSDKKKADSPVLAESDDLSTELLSLLKTRPTTDLTRHRSLPSPFKAPLSVKTMKGKSKGGKSKKKTKASAKVAAKSKFDAFDNIGAVEIKVEPRDFDRMSSCSSSTGKKCDTPSFSAKKSSKRRRRSKAQKQDCDAQTAEETLATTKSAKSTSDRKEMEKTSSYTPKSAESPSLKHTSSWTAASSSTGSKSKRKRVRQRKSRGASESQSSTTPSSTSATPSAGTGSSKKKATPRKRVSTRKSEATVTAATTGGIAVGSRQKQMQIKISSRQMNDSVPVWSAKFREKLLNSQLQTTDEISSPSGVRPVAVAPSMFITSAPRMAPSTEATETTDVASTSSTSLSSASGSSGDGARVDDKRMSRKAPLKRESPRIGSTSSGQSPAAASPVSVPPPTASSGRPMFLTPTAGSLQLRGKKPPIQGKAPPSPSPTLSLETESKEASGSRRKPPMKQESNGGIIKSKSTPSMAAATVLGGDDLKTRTTEGLRLRHAPITDSCSKRSADSESLERLPIAIRDTDLSASESPTASVSSTSPAAETGSGASVASTSAVFSKSLLAARPYVPLGGTPQLTARKAPSFRRRTEMKLEALASTTESSVGTAHVDSSDNDDGLGLGKESVASDSLSEGTKTRAVMLTLQQIAQLRQSIAQLQEAQIKLTQSDTLHVPTPFPLPSGSQSATAQLPMSTAVTATSSHASAGASSMDKSTSISPIMATTSAPTTIPGVAHTMMSSAAPMSSPMPAPMQLSATRSLPLSPTRTHDPSIGGFDHSFLTSAVRTPAGVGSLSASSLHSLAAMQQMTQLSAAHGLQHAATGPLPMYGSTFYNPMLYATGSTPVANPFAAMGAATAPLMSASDLLAAQSSLLMSGAAPYYSTAMAPVTAAGTAPMVFSMPGATAPAAVGQLPSSATLASSASLAQQLQVLHNLQMQSQALSSFSTSIPSMSASQSFGSSLGATHSASMTAATAPITSVVGGGMMATPAAISVTASRSAAGSSSLTTKSGIPYASGSLAKGKKSKT